MAGFPHFLFTGWDWKKFLAIAIKSALQAQVKNVVITTSTGIAGRQYNFQSHTLHS